MTYQDVSLTNRNPINSLPNSATNESGLLTGSSWHDRTMNPHGLLSQSLILDHMGPSVNPGRIRHTSPDTTRKHCRACHRVPGHLDSFEPTGGFSGLSCRSSIRHRLKVGHGHNKALKSPRCKNESNSLRDRHIPTPPPWGAGICYPFPRSASLRIPGIRSRICPRPSSYRHRPERMRDYSPLRLSSAHGLPGFFACRTLLSGSPRGLFHRLLRPVSYSGLPIGKVPGEIRTNELSKKARGLVWLEVSPK